MTDEMEPKLRLKTALATMKSVIYPIATEKGISTTKGYIFDVYIDGYRYSLGVHNNNWGKSKYHASWVVTDLETGLQVSRSKEHKTRKAALETFFNSYEFNSWRKIQDEAVNAFVHGQENWYLKKSEEFTIACRRAGFRKYDGYEKGGMTL